jgi:hypothetical protein
MQINRSHLVALSVACFAGVLHAAQVNQSTLAATLRGPDLKASIAAFRQVESLDPETIDRELRMAMVSMLQAVTAARAAARSRGQSLSSVVDGEYYMAIIDKIAELEDPLTIPILARTSQVTRVASSTLSKFPKLALPELIAVVEDQTVTDAHVSSALLHLIRIVELGSLDSAARSRVRTIARTQLQSTRANGRESSLTRAMYLGVALKDPELIGMVRALADDPQQVRARGFQNEESIERMSRAANEALAKLARSSAR